MAHVLATAESMRPILAARIADLSWFAEAVPLVRGQFPIGTTVALLE